jgi:putative ABC transport system substrate-binding protein
MKRREFIAASAALLVSPPRSLAQWTRRRLGFLAPNEPVPAIHKAWLDGLRNHGWIDGKNLTIEYRYAPSQDRLLAFAAELVALSPDLLVASSTSSCSPEIGNCKHSDSICGCGRSRWSRPRPKPVASGRQ